MTSLYKRFKYAWHNSNHSFNIDKCINIQNKDVSVLSGRCCPSDSVQIKGIHPDSVQIKGIQPEILVKIHNSF